MTGASSPCLQRLDADLFELLEDLHVGCVDLGRSCSSMVSLSPERSRRRPFCQLAFARGVP